MKNRDQVAKATKLKATGEFAHEKQLKENLVKQVNKVFFEMGDKLELKDKKEYLEYLDSSVDKENIKAIAGHRVRKV